MRVIRRVVKKKMSEMRTLIKVNMTRMRFDQDKDGDDDYDDDEEEEDNDEDDVDKEQEVRVEIEASMVIETSGLIVKKMKIRTIKSMGSDFNIKLMRKKFYMFAKLACIDGLSEKCLQNMNNLILFLFLQGLPEGKSNVNILCFDLVYFSR